MIRFENCARFRFVGEIQNAFTSVGDMKPNSSWEVSIGEIILNF